MINVITHIAGYLQTNTYIAHIKGNDNAVLIDPTGEPKLIEQILLEQGLTPKAILITHAHFDHIGAVRHFQKLGATVYMSKLEAIGDNVKIIGGLFEKFEHFKADRNVIDGEIINECGLSFMPLHTPGHSSGGICYICENAIFSGDTLFRLSIGRTDLPGGDNGSMQNSLRKLFSLNKEYTVYPGHGDKTTLIFERTHNPYAAYL